VEAGLSPAWGGKPPKRKLGEFGLEDDSVGRSCENLRLADAPKCLRDARVSHQLALAQDSSTVVDS
jgi:hypothetical protein